MTERLTLIFDLDDTLIQSFPGYVKLHQQVARDLGWRIPTETELIQYGPTWEATVARIWPSVELTPFFHRFEEIVESVIYEPFDGVLDILRALKARGHRLFIVTKRSSKRLKHRMSQAGIETSWFDGIYPADHGPAPKPDPRCFQPIWEKIGWHPEIGASVSKAVYVGDRKEDQLAAERAGLPFIAVLSGPESRLDFPKPGAWRTLETIRELPDVLANIPHKSQIECSALEH